MFTKSCSDATQGCLTDPYELMYGNVKKKSLQALRIFIDKQKYGSFRSDRYRRWCRGHLWAIQAAF